MDTASPALFVDLAKGEHIKDVLVDIGRHVAGNFQLTIQYKLSDVLISSIKPAGSSGGRLLEEVAFNFARVDIIYNQYGADGSVIQAVHASWNVASNTGG